MAGEQKSETRLNGTLCANPPALHHFISTLLDALHLQAKEIESLTKHVEQQTNALLTPSQMPVVVSELSSLRARLDSAAAERL